MVLVVVMDQKIAGFLKVQAILQCYVYQHPFGGGA